MAPSFWFETKLIRTRVFHKYHSDAMNLKPMLLAIHGREHPVIGWYFGGHLKEWRMEGSPSDQNPTHFMPLPQLPK